MTAFFQRTHRKLVVVGGIIMLMVGAGVLTCCSGIVNEIFPRQVVVRPILVMEVDMHSSSQQSQPFAFRYSGRHSVNVELELRQGPQGPRTERESFRLAGIAEIVDEDGEVRLMRVVDHTFAGSEVGTMLFHFDAGAVGRKGAKVFRITVDVDPQFREHYSRMTVFIRKEMKYPIVD